MGQVLQCLCCVVMLLCAMCSAPVCDVYLESLCAGKASVYIFKQANKLFFADQRPIIGGPLLVIVQWVIGKE